MTTNAHFIPFMEEIEAEFFLLIGSYGSSKSFSIIERIIMLCMAEKRKALCYRKVAKDTKKSVYDEFVEHLSKLEEKLNRKFWRVYKSPLSIIFFNGSIIYFDGLENVKGQKSIPGVSIVFVEEANEITREDYNILKVRIRDASKSPFFFMATNPGEKTDWTYALITEDLGIEEEELYKKRIFRKTVDEIKWFVHHSTYKDNVFLLDLQVRMLENEHNEFARTIGSDGRFGSYGKKIFSNIKVISPREMAEKTKNLEIVNGGFDFGFAVSYNALIESIVDDIEEILYLTKEFYANHVTDDVFLGLGVLQEYTEKGLNIYADSEDPKAIEYYNNKGVTMIGAKKGPGSVLSDTRKLQRFKTIYISSDCPNLIREFQSMKQMVDKNGIPIISTDKKKMFGFDPHGFDASRYSVSYYNQNSLKDLVKGATDEL